MLLYVISNNKKDGREIELTLLDQEIEMLLQIISFSNAFLKEQPTTDFIKERQFVNQLEDLIFEKFING